MPDDSMPGPGPAGASNLLLVDHPIVADRVSRLRDKTTPGNIFGRLVAEISAFVAYEALRDLELTATMIDTPVVGDVSAPRIGETVLLVPVLRAGLGMVQSIQQLLPLTRVAHVGLRHDETTHLPEVYLNRLPADLAGQRVMICDPMLATGGSLAAVCSFAFERGASDLTALCLIASQPGLASFHEAHPNVRAACAAVDEELNDEAFIVPGLGDAGDRLFGPPS